jgi:Flp pilus assembly protein TadG
VRRRYPLLRLAKDERAIYTVEFAFLAPVLLLLLMGFFDLAHRGYAMAVLQGAVQKAGRDATLESGQTGTSSRLSYTDFSNVGDPEVFKDRIPLNGKYDAGECFEDVNGNGRWDADLGKAGQGSAQDAVLYKMEVTYPRLLPLASMLGWTANQKVSASTVLRNQPYGDQKIPSVTKCP